MTWSDLLRAVLQGIVFAPFWKDVRFYLALVNAVAIFSKRFGLTLSTEEVGALNLIIMAAAGLGKPTADYVQMQAYQARVRLAEARQELSTLKVGKK